MIDHENEKGTLHPKDYAAFDTIDALLMNSDFYMSKDKLDTIEWFVQRWGRVVERGRGEFEMYQETNE
jgi:hypothetical protein